MTSQLRRAAVSVGAQIAEGAKRRGTPDKVRFWNTAQASAAAIVSERGIAMRLRYSSTVDATVSDEDDEIAAMLGALIHRAVNRGE